MRKFELIKLIKRWRNKLPKLTGDVRPTGWLIIVDGVILRHEKYWSEANKRTRKLQRQGFDAMFMTADNRKLYKKA